MINFDVGLLEVALLSCLSHSGIEAELVDGADTGSGNGEGYPHILLNPVELLIEEVYVEFAFGATLRVRNVVTYHRFLARDLTNL